MGRYCPTVGTGDSNPCNGDFNGSDSAFRW